MALLGRLTRKLLKDEPWMIELLDLHIGMLRIPTKLIPGPESSKVPHTVLKVSGLFAKETWMLDTAGCQYGFREVLVPYKKYLTERSCKIVNEPTAYDATETKDLDYFSTLPFMNRTKAQQKDRKLEEKARLHFAAFVNEPVSKDILNGSTAVFDENLGSFVEKLKLHMLNLGK